MTRISRRRFLGTMTVVPPAFAAIQSRKQHDLVIRGGTVLDGSGGEGREADVAVAAGRIEAIGSHLAGNGALEIDARGLAVAPGFIDIHSHGDSTLFDDPEVQSVFRQGVTTMVVGQDGFSRVPKTPGEDDRFTFNTFSELWRAIDDVKPAVNVASMVGLGTARAAVIGNENRAATPGELERMVAIVERALAEGACGTSSGLEYTPGGFASREELAALCRPLHRRGLPYATHMRNEDDRLIEAVEEAIGVAESARCPLQISHLKTEGRRNWPKLDLIFERIERARRRGVDVAFDRYPYVAYQTDLANLFPIWSRSGTPEQFLARVDDPSAAGRIRAEALAKVELIGGWDAVMISDVTNPDDKPIESVRLGAWAAAHGQDPYTLAVNLLKRNKANVGMVGFAMSEDNLERILSHPRGMVCSDGSAYSVDPASKAHIGHPHPRCFGTFPRVLGRYVRERKVLSLPQAIRKMTSLPASRIGLRDRGRIAAGFAADLVVFDPAKVADRATFENPFQYPEGIHAVVVNGKTDKRSGRALRG